MSLLDDLVDRYLTTQETDAGFSAINLDYSSFGAFWLNLGRTLVGAFVATIALGWQRVINAVFGAWSELLTGVTEFFAGRPLDVPLWEATRLDVAQSRGLIKFIGDEFARFMAAIWSPLGDFGGFAQILFALALLLATWWIVARGIEFAREEVL